MNMTDELNVVQEEITRLKKENLQKQNSIEELSLNHERQIDALLNDFISVIDAYEKAETKIKEMELPEDDNIQRVIKRLLQPKKTALSVLSKNGVSQIDIVGKPLNEDICTVVETEPDNEKENDTVLSIEKSGYIRGERLIRRAEVIIVRN
jgi:molecular chaperone GrpE (heat shock protein)